MSSHTNPYSRRILVAVCGLNPQILTETLYGLIVTATTPFIPTEIHLLTTHEGAHRARLMLLHPEEGRFYRFCQDYDLPPIQFNASLIHVIEDRHGQALDDIRTPDDNECLADAITTAIREYTRADDTALHVSIAGGRKTMGYYAGYAMSLFGREQDRLSHVLVTSEYESHPEFFYPTPHSQVIYTRENRPLDTRDAEVILAEIPFIRLREDIPGRLLSGKAGFSETIALARKASEAPCLSVDRASRNLSANGISIYLPDIQLAFYLWVIDRCVQQETSLTKPGKQQPDKTYAQEFIQHYQTLTGDMRDIDKTVQALRNGMDEQFFQEKMSRVNKVLEQELGKRLAGHFRINNRGHRGQGDYHVALTAEQIRIA